MLEHLLKIKIKMNNFGGIPQDQYVHITKKGKEELYIIGKIILRTIWNQ